MALGTFSVDARRTDRAGVEAKVQGIVMSVWASFIKHLVERIITKISLRCTLSTLDYSGTNRRRIYGVGPGGPSSAHA